MDEMVAAVEGPGLDAFIEKKFGGREYECVLCASPISWVGMCERCEARQSIEGSPPEEKLLAIGVPHAMTSCKWENFELPKAGRIVRQVEEVRRWRGRPPLVVLAGPPGTGKTHMAVAILRRRMEEKGLGGVMWLADAEIGELLRRGFRSDDESLESRMRHARLLFIDDLGQGYQSQWLVETVMPVLCQRADNEKPTVVTTNLTHPDIEAMDIRLASRMHEGLAVSTRDLSDRRRT